MEKIPIKHTLFFILILVTSTHCMIKTVNVMEGDLAFLNFTYSCNSTEVTIQIGNRAPFYNSKSLTLSLSSNQKLEPETDGKICFLYLTIDPVTRDNQGGYILTAYKDDPTQFEDDRIWLVVEYPPGKASCSSSEEHIDQDWVRLQCTAPLGSVGGFIMCYQNGIEIPPLYSPQQHDETLSQNLLAKVGDLVYCCSGTFDQTKDRCECKDSVWDPIQNEQVTNVTDPCPLVTTVQYPTFSQHPEDKEFEVTSPSTNASTGTPPQTCSCTALLWLYGAICFIFMTILIIMSVFIGVRLHHMCKRHPKKRPNLKGKEQFISEYSLEKL